jgi:hypothetical protein
MSEPEQSHPKNNVDLVWPPPVSNDDIVWLEAPQTPQAARPEPESGTISAPTALSLSCFLFPEVLFEWHDAVAVVQQLAEQITDGLRTEPSGSLPDLSDIGIEVTGHLLVRLEPHGRETAVRGLGYLMHQLLANRNGPVALRLLVAQVVSEVPTIMSVPALSQELARWERPRRLEKLIELHERARRFIETRPAAALPDEAQALSPERLAESAAADVADPPAKAEAPPWLQALLRLPRRRGAVGLGLAILVVALTGAALFVKSSSTPLSHAVTAPTVALNERGLPPEAPAPGPVAVSAVARTTASLPLAHQKAPTAAHDIALPPNRSVPQGIPTHGLVSASTVSRGAEVSVPASRNARQTPPVQPAVQPNARQAAAVPPRPELDADEPGQIYKTGDAGFVEAVLIKPYMPEQPDPSTPPDRLGTLELVVNAAGDVEWVRLRSPFNRYRERWWVYVAKNWKFRPGFKDGLPVKSFKRVVITDTRESDPQ